MLQYWWAIVIHDKTTNNNFTKFSWEKGTNFPLCKFKTKVLLEKWNRDCDTTNVTSIYKLRNNYLNDIIISASEDIRQGVIHKVRRLRFRNFSSSSPPVFGHTILAYPPSPPPLSALSTCILVPAYEYYFLKQIWHIFCEWQSNDHT